MFPASWLTAATAQGLRSRRARLWAVILALAALLLVRLPLFGLLGYEFSLAFAVLGSFCGADLGSAIVRRLRDAEAPPGEAECSPLRKLLRCWAGAGLTSVALLMPPLLIVSLAALWTQNCDWLFGLYCFALMACLSTLLASAMGVLCGVVAGRRRWLGGALPPLFILASGLLSLLHFYWAPAVFSYNPFVGYFPGNLYDENIDLRAPFYWARLYHLSVLAAAGATVALWLDPPTMTLHRVRLRGILSSRAVLLALCVTAVASALYLHSGKLGFCVDADDVLQILPGRFESEHFVIYYPADPVIAEQIEVIAADHEFRRAQLVRDLKIDPPGKITSYYFSSPEQKQRFMGARNVYMAKPWRHEIYINHKAFPHPVLRHEIAHVMAGSFGDPIFAVSAGRVLGLPVFFNVGLIEGLAVAVDWPDHFDKALTPHQSVKAMLQLGMKQPVERLFSTGFLSLSSARSYTLAGSYLRFLFDRYGIAKLKVLYKSGGDFEAAYDTPQSQLTAEWRAMIEATQLPPGAAQIVRERFRHKAIFDRPCPHAIARARERMVRAVARGDFKLAIDTARNVCKRVPEEPRYQLQLATLLRRDRANREAKSIYETIAGDHQRISSTLRARALFALVSIAVESGNTQGALSIVDRILSIPLADADLRRAQVYREVLTLGGPAASDLRGIFWPGEGKEIDRLVLVALASRAAAIKPRIGLPDYLVARQLRGRESPATTVAFLRRALARNVSPLVEREAAKLLAESAFLAVDWSSLSLATTILTRDDQPQVTRLLGYDWRERGEWARLGKVPSSVNGVGDVRTQPASE